MIASEQSAQQVAVTVLRTTLLDNALKSLVVDSTGEYKIFWEHVEEPELIPYVCISHLSDIGDLGASQSVIIEHKYKVVATANRMESAVNLDKFIYQALHRVMPNVSLFTDLTAISDIRMTMPVFDRYVIQGMPIFEVGGIFLIRLQIC